MWDVSPSSASAGHCPSSFNSLLLPGCPCAPFSINMTPFQAVSCSAKSFYGVCSLEIFMKRNTIQLLQLWHNHGLTFNCNYFKCIFRHNWNDLGKPLWSRLALRRSNTKGPPRTLRHWSSHIARYTTHSFLSFPVICASKVVISKTGSQKEFQLLR